jgi:hypothetical protein
MAYYIFHDLTLEVKHDESYAQECLAQLLDELSWVRTDALGGKPCLRLSVNARNNGVRVPATAREMFRADGFCGLESGKDFYLTDGASLFHFQGDTKHGDVLLAPSFFSKPPLLQRNFWAFTLIKLLRPFGIYSLHAAGVVTKEGLGILITGEPGSGKSTLTIGLIRRGWGYVSDDAVLLRLQPEGVAALACRKNFYVNADAAGNYADLPLGEHVPDALGGQRRRVHIEEAYPAQHIVRCIPRVLLFPRIVRQTHSALLPLDRATAMRSLLVQSGPQLFDRATMTQHLEVLKRLLYQTEAYELQAGLDLYHDPLKIIQLMRDAAGEEIGTAYY